MNALDMSAPNPSLTTHPNGQAADTKRRRPFSFLFEGVFAQGLNAHDLVRFGVLLCLSVSLFGIDIFGTRGADTFIGKRLGNFGALLYYFNLYLWIPLTILFGLMQIKRGAIRLGALLSSSILPSALLLFLYISVRTSEAPYIADQRWGYFLNMVLPCILTGIVLVDSKSMQLVRDTFLVFAVIKVITFIIAPQGMSVVFQGGSLGISEEYASQLVLENNEIRTGYQLGFMILTAILVLRGCTITKTLEKWGLYILIGLLFFLMLLNGTRGALVALATGLLTIWLIHGGRLRAGAVGLSMVLFLGGFAAFSIMDEFFAQTKQRYLPALTESTSVRERIEFSREALSAEATLTGMGVGSFGADRATILHSVYTHNALTEMYYEGGIIGLALLTAAVFVSMRRLWGIASTGKSVAALFCLCGLVFYFMYAQVSGYLLGNMGFWLFLFCGPPCAALLDKSHFESNHSPIDR